MKDLLSILKKPSANLLLLETSLLLLPARPLPGYTVSVAVAELDGACRDRSPRRMTSVFSQLYFFFLERSL